MTSAVRQTIIAGVVVVGATALVLLIVCLILDRPATDFVLLSLGLLASGSVYALAAILVAHRKMP